MTTTEKAAPAEPRTARAKIWLHAHDEEVRAAERDRIARELERAEMPAAAGIARQG